MLGRGGQLFGQGGQDAWSGFEQGHMKAALVENFKPIVPQGASRIVQLGGQFHPGRAAADDRDAHLFVGGGIIHHRPADAQAVVEQAGAEAVRLHAAVEVEAVLFHPRHTEVVRHRSHRQREDIIADGVGFDQRAAVLVLYGGKADGLGRAVNPVAGRGMQPGRTFVAPDAFKLGKFGFARDQDFGNLGFRRQDGLQRCGRVGASPRCDRKVRPDG